jgi:uncharacterized protein (UPF0332 family)
MAQVSLERTESVLLPAVGFYYSLFHAGVAMLYVDPSTSLDELSHRASGMTHKKLRKLLDERLVSRKLIDKDYIRYLDDSKWLREHVNYVVGGRQPGDADVEQLDERSLYAETGTRLLNALDFIKEVASNVNIKEVAAHDKTSEIIYNGLEAIRSTIGDHFGDDLVGLYVPRQYRSRIWDFLAEHDVTN